MSRNCLSASDHYDVAAPFTGYPLSMFCWAKIVANSQNKHFMNLSNNTDGDRFTLGEDGVTASGQGTMVAVSGNGANVNSANSGSALPTGAWTFLGGSISASGFTKNFWAGATKTANTGIITPATQTKFNISGRITDYGLSANAGLSNAGLAHIVLDDIEFTYLAGGGNPRGVRATNYWKLTSASGTETDQIGSSNLTITGTSSTADDPVIAPWWTAVALGNQSYVQGTPISSLDLTTKFDAPTGTVHYTTSLRKLSAPGTATTATAAGTATNLVPVTSVTGFAAGSYCSITNSTTPILILAISGTTLLIATTQTWATSAAVYPIAHTAQTFTGLTFSTNTFSGTPAAGDVGTYTNVFFRAADTTTATLIGDSPLLNITVSSSGSAPSFTTAPANTATNTDGWAASAICNQTATWWRGVYLKGSTTPTAAQVIAGTGTGFVSHTSASLTATVAGPLTVTGLTLPVYDVYDVVTNGSGNSAVTPILALFVAPAAGKQFVTAAGIVAISAATKANPCALTTGTHGRTTGDWVEVFGVGGMTQLNGLFVTCTVVDTTHLTLDGIDSTAFTTYTSGGTLSWGQSVDSGSSTAVANGDIRVIDTVTSPDGAVLTCLPNGAVTWLPIGSRRQTFVVDTYSVSGGAMIAPATDYLNDLAPIPPSQQGGLYPLVVAGNQNGTTSLANIWTDPQGDTPTVTINSGIPAGGSQSGQNIIGSMAPGIYILAWSATNNSGDSGSSNAALVVTPITVPSVARLNIGAATDTLLASFLQETVGVQDDPTPGGPAAAGTVIAQSPLAGTAVGFNSVVNVTLSSGIAATGIPTTSTTTTAKSAQLIAEEAIGALNSYQVFEGFGIITQGSNDPPGQQYRLFRIPASARILEMQIINSPNPSGSLYRIGVLQPNGGGLVVTGSDSILLSGLSLDTANPNWVNLYSPAIAGGANSSTNVGLRVWELLGLTADPSPPNQDALYDVTLTAINPGSQGGSVKLRIMYLRNPDRGLIAASAVHN